MLSNGNIDNAKKIFEELIVAEPEHHDGYEGLAEVYYELGEKDTALFCINQAYEIAMGFYKEDTLDIEVLEDIEKKKEKIEEMK